MTVKRTPGIPDQECKPTAPAERSLEALQNIFLSPPKFVVGTTASEAAYRAMVATKGGLSAFWEDAITGFDGDLEALVRATAAFEEVPTTTHRGKLAEAGQHSMEEHAD